jgi:hypothetical protein
MVVAEFHVVGVVPEELIERIENCIKANIKLFFSNESINIDGLHVEAKVID